MSLNGRVGIVTGGGSGIGRAISLQLARDGAAIAVWDLNGAAAEETVKRIDGAGGHGIACAVDVSRSDQVDAALAKTHGALGRVAILVNNAGIAPFVRIQDISEEMWDRVMSVNLKGPFLCTKAVLSDMLAAGWGRIVNISSSSAQVGASKMSHYVASKGGVIGFTKALAMELVTTGITANGIAPSFVDTPMLRASPIDIEALSAAAPMKHPGRPEDIAAACSYLVSEAAGYVTGQTLSVNGGRYLT
jgi:2-hydroxycyclohexanecarboxyl-CoA dehydrogenase